MRKLIFLAVFCLMPIAVSSQQVKSFRIHLQDNREGWSYGLDEIDSINIDVPAALQNIYFEDNAVSYPLTSIDSVSLSKDDAPMLYTCLKFKNDPAIYLFNRMGYVRIYEEEGNEITGLDAFINDNLYFITFNHCCPVKVG